MKILNSITIILILIFAVASNSYATDVINKGGYDGLYMALNIGGSQLNDDSYQATDFDFNFGNTLGLAIGKDFGEVRLEAQFSRSENDIDAINGGRASGDVTATSFMANVYGDFENESGIVSYIGIGLGNTTVDFNSPSTKLGPILGTKESDSDSVFTYAIMGGLTFQSSKTLLFDLGLKYTDSDEVEVGTTPNNLKLDYTATSITFGFRKYF